MALTRNEQQQTVLEVQRVLAVAHTNPEIFSQTMHRNRKLGLTCLKTVFTTRTRDPKHLTAVFLQQGLEFKPTYGAGVMTLFKVVGDSQVEVSIVDGIRCHVIVGVTTKKQ